MWLLVALFCGAGLGQYFRGGALERTGARPVLVVTCDFSGDGIHDFAVTNFVDNTISVFVNQPTGSVFRPQTVAPANGPFGIACIDMNRDGRKDLVWGNDGKQGAIDNTLSYVLNQGFDGSAVIFSAPVLLTIGFNPSDIAVADFDMNGSEDLVITLTDNNQVAVLYNMHDGNASSPVSFEQVTVAVGASPYDVSVGDMDGDTFADIVVTNNGANTISILLNKGDRTFFQLQQPAGVNPLGIWVADFNSDGWQDVCVSTGNSLGVMLNTHSLPGTVTFGAMVFFTTGSSPAEVVGGDFDRDGRIDLAVPNYYSNTLSVLINKGTPGGPAAFAPAVNYNTGSRPWGIDAGDFNLDNVTDLVVTNVADNTASLFYGSSVVQPTARPFGSGVSGGAVFGIIVAIAFGTVILLLIVFYLLRWRTIRRLPPPDSVSPARNPDSREISLATISSNPRMQTFPAGPPQPAPVVYPVANVNLADTPVGAPTYQPPPPERIPPTPPKTPSEHDFDL